MTTWNLCLICHHEMAYHAEIDGRIVCPRTDPDEELAPGDTGAKLIAEAFEAMEKVLGTHDERITAIRKSYKIKSNSTTCHLKNSATRTE